MIRIVAHTGAMSLTTWRTFVSVCRTGSLSAAAEEQGYTQSAVSRHMATLEREVGTALLERSVRGTRPTVAGEAFLRHAVMMVNSAERAVRAARDAGHGPSAPPLAIGATPSLAAGVVPTVMRRTLDRSEPFPWTLVPGLSQALHDRLLLGELDIAVVTDAPPGVPEDSRVDRVPLGHDEMMVAVPADHVFARSDSVHIEELADEGWAEDNEGSATLLRQHAARAGLVARVDHTAADLPGKLALVAAGHAIALVPGCMAETLRPDVSAIRLDAAPTRGIYACVPHTPVHPATQRVIAEITARLSGAGG